MPSIGRSRLTAANVKLGAQRLAQRPALRLLAANLGAQAISLGVAPILAHLYAPEAFGSLGLISAIAMVLLPLATGRYELALMRARSEREARAVLKVCFSMIVVGGLSTGAVFALAAMTLNADWTRPIREHWYFVPLSLCAIALYDTLAIEASRTESLDQLARSKLTQALLGAGSQVVFGLAQIGVSGLLLGFVLTQGAGVSRLLRGVLRGPTSVLAVSWEDAWQAARQHRELPMYSSWSATLDVAAKWSIQILIPIFWDVATGGYLFLAERIVGRPLMLVSTSLMPVFVADVSREVHTNPRAIRAIYRRTLLKQSAICILWTALVVTVAPFVIVPVFGRSWSPGVPFVQLVAIATAPAAALHPVSHTLQLVGRSRVYAIVTVFRVIATGALVYACAALHTSAVMLLSLQAALQYVFAVAVFISHRSALSSLERAEPADHADDTRHLVVS